MALAHQRFGEAAHQQVHQPRAAVGAQHQQVGFFRIGVIDQLLRHFLGAFGCHQQMRLHVGHAGRFGRVRRFGQHFVAAGNRRRFVAFVLQKLGRQRHIFAGIGHGNQRQAGFNRFGQLGGVLQGIKGSFAAVHSND